MTTSTTKPSSQETGSKSKLKTFSDRFKLNSHFEIERFGVISIVIIVVGAMIVTFAGISAYRSAQADISDTTMYTPTFVTSRTDQTGTVDGVFTNELNTRAVVLFSFDEPENMSGDPADYEAYITGVNSSGAPEKVKTAMSGSIVGFGNTGTMAVIMDAPGGFEMQRINITMGANKELVDTSVMDAEKREKLGYDDSFTTTDQWRMVINPAGREAGQVGALNEEELNMRSFFNDTYMFEQEREQRKTLDELLAQMKTAQDRITNFYDQAENQAISLDGDPRVSLVPPLPPVEIAGDVVDGDSNAAVARQVAELGGWATVMDNPGAPELGAWAEKSERALWLDYDPKAVDYTPNTYELLTTTVVDGGFNFDWRNSSIEDGYLSTVVPSGADAENFLSEMAKIKPEQEKINTDELVLSNGRFLSDYELTDTRVQSLKSIGTNLVQAYNRFYELKLEYQRVALHDLLKLELDLDRIVENTKISSEADQVRVRR